MGRVILARHGQTASNVEGSMDTAAPGAPLTELGRQQAAELAVALADEPIGAVFCSTLLRARQTAAPVAERFGLTPVVREGIREVQAGALEGRTDDARFTYRDVAYSWIDGDRTRTMPGMEMTGEQFLRGYDSVVAEAVDAAGAGTALLVTHGTAMRVWTAARCADVAAEFARAHLIPNTGTIVLDGDCDADPATGWRLVSWHDAAVQDPA